MYNLGARNSLFPGSPAGCGFADLRLRSTMLMINKALQQAARQKGNLPSHSIKKSYNWRRKKCGEKKGVGNGTFSSYLAANKWCKNVAFRVFHDADDNKGSYTLSSTMLMNTIEKPDGRPRGLMRRRGERMHSATVWRGHVAPGEPAMGTHAGLFYRFEPRRGRDRNSGTAVIRQKSSFP